MRDFGECEKPCRKPEIVVRERGSRFVLKNPKGIKVRVVEIDGCVIKEGPRCDWLFVATGDPTEIYVELKGSDIGHAIKQIKATIPQVSENARSVPKQCYIVGRRVPPGARPQVQLAQLRFPRAYSAKLMVRNSVAEHELGAKSKGKRRR